MKILIAYAGKSGTTAKCAKLLSKKFKNAVLADLCVEKPNPVNYDVIVLGSSIRMGKLHKQVKQYLTKNQRVLRQKRTAYFICCGFLNGQEELFSKNIPQDILENAIATACFGGEIDINRLHGIDKLIAKMVIKALKDKKLILPKIQYENIEKFAEQINNM